jgi:hypothetical protein
MSGLVMVRYCRPPARLRYSEGSATGISATLAGEEPVGVGAESRELAALESPIVIEGEAGEGAAIGDTTADGDAGAGAEDLTMEGRTGHWDVDARSV